MAMQVIPVNEDADFYVIRTTLDGQQYTLDFLWNDRDSGWWLTLSDVNEVPIWSGRLRVGFWDLLAFCPNPSKPPGAFLAFDPLQPATDGGPDIGRGELGTRVLFTYVEAG